MGRKTAHQVTEGRAPAVIDLLPMPYTKPLPVPSRPCFYVHTSTDWHSSPPHLVPSARFPGLSEVELEGPRQAEKSLIVIPVHLTT